MAEEKKDPVEQETAETAETAEDVVTEEQTCTQQTEDVPEEAAEADEKEADADPETAEEKVSSGEDTAENTTGDKKSDKTSRFFGKSKKDDKKDQQIAELTDQVKRQMAEFDNFRKRTEKEKSAMFEVGARSVLEKLLPIVDNFERGLAAVPEAEKESSTAVGMEKIYKQLVKAMEELDVKPIEAVGKEFSPDFHNAVMQAEEEGVDENIIVEEFQKGYLYRGSVLRHSMVKVNK